MFIANDPVFNNNLPRMVLYDLSIDNFYYINLNKIQERREILIYVYGNLYTSDSSFMQSNVKPIIEKNSIKILKKHKIEGKNKNPVILSVDNNNVVELICYVSKDNSIVSPNAGYNSTHNFYMSSHPPGSGKCAIVSKRNKDNVKLYFLDRFSPTCLRQSLALVSNRYFFHEPKKISVTGLFLALCLCSQKYGIDLPHVKDLQFLINLIREAKNFGHTGFSDAIKEDVFIETIMMDRKIQNIETNDYDITLSDIIENPRIICDIEEATDIIIDIDLADTFQGTGRIRELYVEDSILMVVVVPTTQDERVGMEFMMDSLNKALEGIDFMLINHNVHINKS
jgi:hypothetical protein